MRLGDLDALKEELKQYFTDGVLDGVSAKLAFNQILHDIDNAPTVEITEEQAIDKLHETGWLQEHDKQMTERPQGEWKVLVDKHNVQTCKCSICGRIEVISHYDFDRIPFCHCGADMRKPNCVTCDHFGDCDGCERSGEE